MEETQQGKGKEILKLLKLLVFAVIAVFAVFAVMKVVAFLNPELPLMEIVRDSDPSLQEIKLRVAKQQIHIAKLRGLQVQTEALRRLSASMRKARTNEEVASVRADEAKLRMLKAEEERTFEAIEAMLPTATEKDLDQIIEKINR